MATSTNIYIAYCTILERQYSYLRRLPCYMTVCQTRNHYNRCLYWPVGVSCTLGCGIGSHHHMCDCSHSTMPMLPSRR